MADIAVQTDVTTDTSLATETQENVKSIIGQTLAELEKGLRKFFESQDIYVGNTDPLFTKADEQPDHFHPEMRNYFCAKGIYLDIDLSRLQMDRNSWKRLENYIEDKGRQLSSILNEEYKNYKFKGKRIEVLNICGNNSMRFQDNNILIYSRID